IDKAMVSEKDKKNVGGIDFNPATLNIKYSGESDGANSFYITNQGKGNFAIEGLYFDIINISIVDNLPVLLGVMN
ncbi:MAG TPA: hypothetical protein PKH98_02450, partial [Candidatus Omnitrophota bacterium]|nr:hypothetical protein [Candidatus Omnitrophota bacterium]